MIVCDRFLSVQTQQEFGGWVLFLEGRKEMFNDTLNTFYLRLYGRKSVIDSQVFNPSLEDGYCFWKEGRKCFI